MTIVPLIVLLYSMASHAETTVCWELFASPSDERLDFKAVSNYIESPDGLIEIQVKEHIVSIKNSKSNEVLGNYVLDPKRAIAQVQWSPDSKKIIVVQEQIGQNSRVAKIFFSLIDVQQERLHTLSAALPAKEVEADDIEFLPEEFLHSIGMTNHQITSILENGNGFLQHMFFTKIGEPVWAPDSKTVIVPASFSTHDVTFDRQGEYYPTSSLKTVFLLFRAEEPFNLREEGHDKNLITVIGFFDKPISYPIPPQFIENGKRILHRASNGINYIFDAYTGQAIK